MVHSSEKFTHVVSIRPTRAYSTSKPNHVAFPCDFCPIISGFSRAWRFFSVPVLLQVKPCMHALKNTWGLHTRCTTILMKLKAWRSPFRFISSRRSPKFRKLPEEGIAGLPLVLQQQVLSSREYNAAVTVLYPTGCCIWHRLANTFNVELCLSDESRHCPRQGTWYRVFHVWCCFMRVDYRISCFGSPHRSDPRNRYCGRAYLRWAP